MLQSTNDYSPQVSLSKGVPLASSTLADCLGVKTGTHLGCLPRLNNSHMLIADAQKSADTLQYAWILILKV